MIWRNLVLLIIDIVTDMHIGKMFAPSARIYSFFYNQVFNGASFPAIARSSKKIV